MKFHDVLTPLEHKEILQARKKAKRGKEEISVRGYSRLYYALPLASQRLLVNFDSANRAVFRLCSRFDRSELPPTARDKRRAWQIIQLLVDTFQLE